MKFKLYGEITERSMRHVKKADGSSYDAYSLVIKEPGKYPHVFKVTTKDPSMLGQKDGPFAVGKFVTAEGFINGNVKDAVSKDGKPFKSYNIYLTLSSLETAVAPSAAQPGEEEIADDMPF